MKHSISINKSNNSIIVKNLKTKELKVEFIRLSDNFCVYNNNIATGMFSSCFTDENENYRVYIKETDDFHIDFYIYDVIRTKTEPLCYEINQIPPSDFFDFNNEIYLITGSAGGGTSVVTKFLKLLGAHGGDDSSVFETRKPHEPMGFKLWVSSLTEKIPIFYHKQNLNKVISTYNYKQGVTNIIKIPECEHQLSLLGEIFPNLSVITIIREQNNFFGTNEGKRFHNMDKSELHKKQFPIIEGLPVFNLDFYKFFTDYNYVNKVLRFLKLNHTISNEHQFLFIKEKINFDERALKKK